MALVYRQVTATYVDANGNPRKGYVEFTPSTYLVLTGEGLVPNETVQAWLDDEGKISISLLCNNSAGVSPAGWKWIIEEKIPNGNTGYLDVPDGVGALDITYSLIAGTNPPYYGIQGPASAPADNGSYATDIGTVIAGVPITVIHNLATYDVVVDVHRKEVAGPSGSTSDLVDVDIETLSANSVRLTFADNAAANAYRVIILSAGGNSAVAAYTGIYNVRNYGALGNGVADDTISIQAAINAAQTDGTGTVYLPTGNYLITDTLLISKGITFQGEGRYCQIIFSTSATSTHAIEVNRAIGVGNDPVRFRDFFMYDQRIGTGNKIGIKIVNGTVQMERVQVYYFGSHGFHVLNTGNHNGSTFTDCASLSCGGDGILVSRGTDNQGILILNFLGLSCKGYGINFEGFNSLILNPIVEGYNGISLGAYRDNGSGNNWQSLYAEGGVTGLGGPLNTLTLDTGCEYPSVTSSGFGAPLIVDNTKTRALGSSLNTINNQRHTFLSRMSGVFDLKITTEDPVANECVDIITKYAGAAQNLGLTGILRITIGGDYYTASVNGLVEIDYDLEDGALVSRWDVRAIRDAENAWEFSNTHLDADGNIVISIKSLQTQTFACTAHVFARTSNGNEHLRRGTPAMKPGKYTYNAGTMSGWGFAKVTGTQIGAGQTTKKIGFYGTAPVVKPTGVGVDAASIHAALVSLGLIS